MLSKYSVIADARSSNPRHPTATSNDTMQKPLDIDNYSISQNGFLPEHLPLEQLPDPSYSNWEDIAANLPTLIKVGRVRDAVLDCPILSTDNLASCEEWMRAYVLLTYISHAYIWGGDYPAEVGSIHHRLRA